MFPFYQLFSTVGDGTGVSEMATTAANYYIIPPTDYRIKLHRITLYMEDNGKFRGDYYSATGALSTGIIVTYENASGVIATLTPTPIKKIDQWSLCAGVDTLPTDFIAGNDTFNVRWTFTSANGAPLTLSDKAGTFIKVAADNLSDLVSHLMAGHGNLEWEG